MDEGEHHASQPAPAAPDRTSHGLPRQSPTGAKPKQKRNKPTLNCKECVERRSKCDRGRPKCLVCIRRQSTCRYTQIADILVATEHLRPHKLRRIIRDGDESRCSINAITNPHSPENDSTAHLKGWTQPDPTRDVQIHPPFKPAPSQPANMLGESSLSNHGQPGASSPMRAQLNQQNYHAGNAFHPLMEESPPGGYVPPGFQGIMQPQSKTVRPHAVVSSERPAPFNVFGMGSQHPFHNYWTSGGGLSEVINVLPSKEEADFLVSRYFESVDPFYPFICLPDFETEYNRFWSLSEEERHNYDAALLSLQFVIYATGIQFMEAVVPEERIKTAEFYLSASHQCLIISSYLNCPSTSTIQTMVLICYFLINNNHASEAWNFSGVTNRQAHALELNRNPEIVRPNCTFKEKQLHCRLWQATMFQDTGLSLYLKLPPTTIHYDILPSALKSFDEHTGSDGGVTRTTSNDFSISTDVEYLRCMWEFACFVQTHVCIPKSLDRPLSLDPTDQAQLIAQYRHMYNSWPEPFNSFGSRRFDNPDPRLARQLIAVSSHYFYVLTILYMESNEKGGVVCNVYGALDAAHEAMSAFFALSRLCPSHVDIWGAYHTRGFAQAMMIGTLLTAQKKSSSRDECNASLMLAKSNFDRYLEVLMRARGTSEYEAIQKQRVADLQALRDKITVV